MSTIRVNNVTDELGTGAPDFPNGITIDTVTVSGKIVHTGDTDTSIGFPINDTITMDTAGTERMRIDSSGNVGIGVTPTVPLHVVNASTPRIYLGSDASKYSGLVYTAGTTFGSVAIRGQGNDIGTVLHVDRDNSQVRFDTSGTERMRIDSSGKVLIGTATSVSNNMLVIDQASGDGVNSGFLMQRNGAAGTSFKIDIDSSDVANFRRGVTNAMSIDSSGNVGIGTITPLRPLSVAASSAEAHIFAGRTATDGNLGITAAGGRVSLGSTSAATGVGYEGARIGMIAAQAWTVGSAQGSSLVFENTANGTATLKERMRIDSAGYVGIGTTSPNVPLDVSSTGAGSTIVSRFYVSDSTVGLLRVGNSTTGDGSTAPAFGADATSAVIYTNNAERARIDSTGYLLVGKTALNGTDIGFFAGPTGLTAAVVGTGAGYALYANRQNDDGILVTLRQANTQEGSISVSGTTVSYNGGHLSRWAQFPDKSRPELLKGTVMSNLDQMSNWDNEDNEQLNCVQVSTVEGDPDVAGVFVAWDSTDDGYNDILLAMTGDMVIRIAAGTVVKRGDLLMSAGDGTAKPQEDDIVRSKTIAKVTSTHISHIYEDGSYCVPCVIMAC